MKDPRDLVVCPFNKVIYISDRVLQCIHIVYFIDNSNLIVKRWRLRENYEPWGLSVTSKYNLLVTVHITGIDEGTGKVVEYTSEGQLIRNIELETSIKYPWQTVQLSSDQFIISHASHDNSLHRLCVINSEGQIIKCYGREEGNDGDQLAMPRSLAIDNKRDRLFVSDMSNKRVLMFSLDLTLLGEVRTRYPFREPGCLHFGVGADKLFLGISRENLNNFTVVRDQFFMIYNRADYIQVYDSDTLSEKTRIYIPNMYDPQYLAGCSFRKCLYISDGEVNDIAVIRLNLTDNSVKKWKIKERYRPRGLSVILEHNLLVAVEIEDRSVFKDQYRLLEYMSEGDLISDIEIERKREFARQAVQLSRHQSVVYEWFEFPRLFAINSMSQVIESLSNKIGGGKERFVMPHSIAIDRNRGHVFLADRRNNRVRMLSRDLTLIGQVQTRNDLYLPCSLYFDSSSDRLFIGEWRIGRVLVIQSPDRFVKKMSII